MRLLEVQAAVSATVLLLSWPCEAKLGHQLSPLDILKRRHSHRRHLSKAFDKVLQKRATCEFPTDAGLVAVTPGSKNGGWAQAPDMPCSAGSYCPYACPPGQVMAQWNPEAKSYTYPASLDGGLYCDSNGKVSKPIPDSPYCVDGAGSVAVKNKCGSTVAFCQTVLPGDESMVIPTAIHDLAGLAVPDATYWASTAAHYYVNPPGVSTDKACVWGEETTPVGNWSPYVAGANQVSSGITFVKIGWNPKFIENSALTATKPKFGLKIVCAGSGCTGLPCSIDPSSDGVGGVKSSDQGVGAGGASFCVVTVPKGESAEIVVFKTDSSSSSGSPDASDLASDVAGQAVYKPDAPSKAPEPEEKKSNTSPSSSERKSSSLLLSSAEPTSSFSASPSSALSGASEAFSKTSRKSSPLVSSSSGPKLSSASRKSKATYPAARQSAHVLFESKDTTTTVNGAYGGSDTTPADSPIAQATNQSGAPKGLVASGSMSSLVVMCAAASYLLL
ncbi:uncharacterized protein L3040_001998 [Drepanopeziza brunnea f. sp. 'multigermtubi']|uniref:uncharacterized protein n=1 Tax=Drepanopeziza brunnea f. sp. 'multigermtubi' TaxID=698441 RepID=UPI002398F327|nr:hypothetical protein L3040_001998 [Drepanopeziza brunnea f. sp. 'multigermtubi']